MSSVFDIFAGLTPAVGIALLVVFVLFGRLFRDAWKAKAPGWKRKCAVYGGLAFASFLAIAFIPLEGV